ncbi:Plasmodium exported protein, unknown function [Plasmodium malariae]|uniref:Uncharacterized protein n=1 Tax=Plasmodium malariae TaxID=5858 RepID=A0A1D3TDG3_PLAMA|nr:Plasmodium exported protein, unknown function [Plasmodium malariae]SCP02939.1 Plasmodium exported protein, unknown function [Plasmodium malariae]
MKESFNSTIFIKIFIFTLLIWIIHYNNKLNRCSGLLDETYKLDRNLCLTTNRLLAHYSVNGKFDVLYSKVLDEDVSENNKDTLLKNEELKDSTLKRVEWGKVAKSNKSSLFSRVDVLCEKKIFSLLDSFDKIRNNEEINDWEKCKAINRKKIKLALIPLSLLVLSLSVFLKLVHRFKEPSTKISSDLLTIILLGLIFAMIISIVLGIIYTYEKIKKYRMIKKI